MQRILVGSPHNFKEPQLSDPANSSDRPRRSTRQGTTHGSHAGPQDPADPPAASGGEHSGATQDVLGRALSELLENPLVTGALGRAWGAREKAAQAQELAMGALNLPSAADIERLTRRLRSVSQRLEGVEDGLQGLGRSFGHGSGIEARLEGIEVRLAAVGDELGALRTSLASTGAARAPASKAPTRSAAKPKG